MPRTRRLQHARWANTTKGRGLSRPNKGTVRLRTAARSLTAEPQDVGSRGGASLGRIDELTVKAGADVLIGAPWRLKQGHPGSSSRRLGDQGYAFPCNNTHRTLITPVP
jgi:hypothetical protein